MKSGLSKLTRRAFLAVLSIGFIQFLLGCSRQQPFFNPTEGHHMKDGFQNIPELERESGGGFGFFFRRFKNSFKTVPIPDGHKRTEKEALDELNRHHTGNSLTWIGHATFLFRVNGTTILTDPFFSDFASPVSWAGPNRYVQPGLSLDNLPVIDTIIISHNHYDHLDADTIKALPNKETTAVIVPLGLKSFFTDFGYTRVTELDWGKTAVSHGITFTCLPAVHFSSRSLFDRNKTLWCSWAFSTDQKHYYFSGDTGYSPTLFKKTGEIFKAFELAVVPIGAYAPRTMMKPVHTNPEEAFQMGLDLNAKTLVSSHWGTIELSDEPHFEPPERFMAEAKKNGFPLKDVWNMAIGQTRAIT